jgi:hypothetical protein
VEPKAHNARIRSCVMLAPLPSDASAFNPSPTSLAQQGAQRCKAEHTDDPHAGYSHEHPIGTLSDTALKISIPLNTVKLGFLVYQSA